MNQPRFDFSAETGHRAYARSSDPDTSHAAATRVAPHVGPLEGRVFGALLAIPSGLGGLTVREISVHTRIDKWSISPRMKPLEDKGFIRRLRERRDGATVWTAC